MPLTRAAQQDREADTVRSGPGREGLYVPTPEHVVANLERIRKILLSPNCTEAYKQRCREDADVLLERLLMLWSVRWPDGPDDAEAGR